jgi:hypothetical protein
VDNIFRLSCMCSSNWLDRVDSPAVAVDEALNL